MMTGVHSLRMFCGQTLTWLGKDPIPVLAPGKPESLSYLEPWGPQQRFLLTSPEKLLKAMHSLLSKTDRGPAIESSMTLKGPFQAGPRTAHPHVRQPCSV